MLIAVIGVLFLLLFSNLKTYEQTKYEMTIINTSQFLIKYPNIYLPSFNSFIFIV